MRLSNSEWNALERICSEEDFSRNKLIEIIESNNKAKLGLTYMTRLFTLYYFFTLATEPNRYTFKTKGTGKIIELLDELYSLKN